MFRKAYFLIFVLVVLSFNVYAGDIPRVIIHQGYLTDTNGNPVNGNVNISFGIYDVESGGTALLEEDIGSVNIKDGFYALEIGKNVNLMSLFADKYSLYLEVRINNEALTPRQRIGSVPFAFTAYDAVGDIHPRSIYVNGKLLIDETGKWVGDASTIPGVKSITAASPLTGGTITDTGTIGISKADAATDGYLSKDDFALFFNKQNRITGVCPNGTCVKKINEDGTVECEVCGGAVSISAGTGIVVDPNPIVGIGTISIDRAYLDSIYVLKGETSAITGAMIADGSITGADIADNSIPLTKLSRVGCTNGQVIKYYVEQPGVEYFMCDTDNTGITSCDACDSTFVNEGQVDSITTDMVKDGAITKEKINASNCSNGQILKYSSASGKWECASDETGSNVSITGTGGIVVNPDPITGIGTISLSNSYQDGSAYDSRFVNEGQTNSITSAMITDGTITGDDIANGTITLSKLNKSGCSNGQVIKYYVEQPGVEYFMCDTDNTGITSCNTCDSTFVNEGQANSITSAMIVDGTITNSDIATGSYPNITGVGTLGSLTVSGNTYLATSSGNVGIGTTSPSKLLHLYRSSNLSGNTGIKLTYNFTGPVNGERSSEWEIYAKSTYGSFEIANAGGAKFHINGETEYVGIGNTSPTQKLDVTGNIRASGQLISGAATGTPPLSVSSTTQVNNLNADMVDSWHAAVHLSGLQDNLYGTNSTNWVELSRWAVDFDSIPGATLRGIGFVSSSAGSIAGRIRFLVNGSQVGSDCTFTATTAITALNCPVITYSKPSGIGYIQIQIRRDIAGTEYVYYGYDTMVLK
jgi:hypothetical protein